MRRDQPKKWGRYSSLLWAALIVLVSACTTTGQVRPLHVTSGITSMTWTIGGEEFNDVLKSKSNLENGIKDFAYHDNTHGDNLGQLIAQMRASNMNPAKSAPGFTGIGGVLGHEVLTIALEALKPAGQYDQEKRVVVTMEGQIIDYEFDGSVGNPGNGKLTVITAVTSRVVPSGGGNPPAKTVGYKWEIEVKNNGFQVVSHSNNDNDPFPNTMTFSPAMLNRVESLGFRYKLWATGGGNGENIVVKNVWQKRNFKWQNVNIPNYWGNPLPRVGNVPWKRLYQSDSKSCIDMMFVNTPPATFQDLQGPPWYCLGRCAHPGIINSR